MICFFFVEIRTALYRDFTEKSMLLIYEIVFDTALDGGAENAGVENAGVENAGVDRRGGKCRSDNVWKAEI